MPHNHDLQQVMVGANGSMCQHSLSKHDKLTELTSLLCRLNAGTVPLAVKKSLLRDFTKINAQNVHYRLYYLPIIGEFEILICMVTEFFNKNSYCLYLPCSFSYVFGFSRIWESQ
jgi:hypothetical protein